MGVPVVESGTFPWRPAKKFSLNVVLGHGGRSTNLGSYPTVNKVG